MKYVTLLFLVAGLVLVPPAVLADPAESLGYNDQTQIIPDAGDGEFCPGTVLLRNDDDTFENGYAWRFAGVVEPDYGAWAECYESDFVCGVEYMLTQTGYYIGQTMDVYVWGWDPEGSPPPGPDPGNVLCVLNGVSPGPVAFWPDISSHDIRVCCVTNGFHFIGYWPRWPGEGPGWFIAVDEDGPGLGCPRSKMAPGIGYPTGWNHPNLVGTFAGCKALGLREYSGQGDCEPTARQATSWGRIKSIY